MQDQPGEGLNDCCTTKDGQSGDKVLRRRTREEEAGEKRI